MFFIFNIFYKHELSNLLKWLFENFISIESDYTKNFDIVTLDLILQTYIPQVS